MEFVELFFRNVGQPLLFLIAVVGGLYLISLTLSKGKK